MKEPKGSFLFINCICLNNVEHTFVILSIVPKVESLHDISNIFI